MLATEYIEDIDFSGCLKTSYCSIRWKNLLKRRKKKKKKSYDEKDYAFGLYQINPCPPEKNEERIFFYESLSKNPKDLSDILESLCKQTS